MENYNIFSPSTTSASSSSNYNFPFSLTSDHSNNFDVLDYDHNNHNNNQSEPLMIIMGEQNEQYQPSMLEVQGVVEADNKQVIKDNEDIKKEFKVIKSDNSNKGKKGLSEKKAKKHRYAFQTRSQVDILDDGYRWRKYGQKAVKNNKFPRSYYRCTYQGCNVKKQVQRLSKDEGVVVTTYEGIHSHSIESSTDNFEHILSQMQIYTSF